MNLRRISCRTKFIKYCFFSKSFRNSLKIIKGNNFQVRTGSQSTNVSTKVRFWLGQDCNTKLNFFFYIGLAFLWPVKRSNSTASEAEQEANDISNVLKQADILFENGHYDECYNFLSNSTCSKDVEAVWRICRALYNMSKDLKYNCTYRKELVYQAFNIIEERLEDNWNNYAVHKWYALLLDAKSSYEGTKERIKQLQNVKKHMDLAVTINPDDATTLHMLGEWCYQVAELPWHQRKIAETLFATPPHSSYEDALEYFLRAEAVQPRFYSLNLLRLGNCYVHLKKEDQAKYYLKLAASYPAKSNDDHRANKEATDLLKKFKNV